MSNNNTTIEPIEFERLPTESVEIDSEDVARAIALTQNIPDSARQWQSYLNGLAVFGLEKWVKQWDSNLTLDWQKSTIAKYELANAIPVVANLQIGQFKICAIALGSFFDEEISLPRLVVDLPEYAAHFYLAVEVLQEQGCCIVQGLISYDQLTANLQTLSPTDIQPDWTYQTPLEWFQTDPNHLFLYLQTLEANTISLPTISGNQQRQLTAIANQLSRLLPQLENPGAELWEILTWEQGKIVFSSPDLLEWIYQLQTNQLQTNQFQTNQLAINSTNSNQESLQTYLLDFIKLLTRPAINLGRWLRNELDETGEALQWELLPAQMRESRSPIDEFRAIQSELENTQIPPQARSGYYDFNLGGNPLRIYATAWNSSTEDNPHTWSLLLILDAPEPNTLPNQLKFRISDRTGILFEQQIDSQVESSYLYAYIEGGWDEKFLANVGIADGDEVTLAPFAFDLRQV